MVSLGAVASSGALGAVPLEGSADPLLPEVPGAFVPDPLPPCPPGRCILFCCIPPVCEDPSSAVDRPSPITPPNIPQTKERAQVRPISCFLVFVEVALSLPDAHCCCALQLFACAACIVGVWLNCAVWFALRLPSNWGSAACACPSLCCWAMLLPFTGCSFRGARQKESVAAELSGWAIVCLAGDSCREVCFRRIAYSRRLQQPTPPSFSFDRSVLSANVVCAGFVVPFGLACLGLKWRY